MNKEDTNKMEQEIEDLGLNAPRITLDHVSDLMSRVSYESHRVPGTNTTQCVAIINGFTLATGETSCVDDANFNAELGLKYAKVNAENQARSKLYELEGYKLKFGLEGEIAREGMDNSNEEAAAKSLWIFDFCNALVKSTHWPFSGAIEMAMEAWRLADKDSETGRPIDSGEDAAMDEIDAMRSYC